MATSTVNSITSQIIPHIAKSSGSRGPFLPSSSPLAHGVSAQNFTSSDSEDAIPERTQPTSSSSRQGLTPSKSHVPPKDPTKVILSGYLMKCGSKRHNWRKRWFVLSGEKLVYSGSHMVILT